MIYKLASRDNVDTNTFEAWPAVLDNSFTKFNNEIEKTTFHSEDDILNWLESRSRTKSFSRHTNIQDFRNGDPNKLYSVYCCEHDNPDHDSDVHDTYLYSLRFKRPHEASSTFLNERGQRIQSSFKRINNKLQINEVVDEFSSDPRYIKNEFYEGIYPLEIDENDPVSNKYMKFVMDVHELDTDENKEKGFTIITADTNHGSAWLEQFLLKLECVEKYLYFFANGGNIYTKLEKDEEHEAMSNYILKILDDHKQDAEESHDVHTRVKNLVVDPYLCNQEVFQIRYNKTFISWYRSYSQIMRAYNLVPSRAFADIILNFTLADFYSQIQSKQNLSMLIKNLESLYNITNKPVERKVRYMKKRVAPKPRFQRVVRSFKHNYD